MLPKSLLRCITACATIQFFIAAAPAQKAPVADTTAADALLDRTVAAHVLTTPGAQPFHAVLDIAVEKSTDPNRHGRIELFWSAPGTYALNVESPSFSQKLIVHGDAVHESDQGDFYPAWLQAFVSALLDPLAPTKGMHGHPNASSDQPYFADFCIERDDRRSNVLDATADARICFSKAMGMQLNLVQDFTHSLFFKDFRPFHAKSIAYTYNVTTRDNTSLRGTLSTLEDWTPNDTQLAIGNPTPPADRILTTFVSTATEQSLLESRPKDVHWPELREGKLEGNMVIHAVTDRTGQVREASQFDSDNNSFTLSSYGRDLALQYKFKPLMIDGVAQQMEMPLVLHFTTKIGTPIPEVDNAWLRANAKQCKLPTEIDRIGSAGKQIDVTLRISADGKLQGVGGGEVKFVQYMFQEFPSCKLPPVMQNGKASNFIAHLTLIAR
jgi:hypothetical protein